jgi:predicted XRE-type DNA-binding protein
VTLADPLVTALEMYHDSIEGADDAREHLRAEIAGAVQMGMSQSEVAQILGWPRQRVSQWLR